MILGIDATTYGSGGAQRHLIEILKCFNPSVHGFSKIIIWGGDKFLEKISDRDYFCKISHSLLNKSLLHRFLWQCIWRERSFKEANINVLFNPFGTYLGNFRPFATMSQNMLVFDKNEQKRFGWSFFRLKFALLFQIQKASFSKSQGIIFISNYAKNSIAKHVDYSNLKIAKIYNGISDEFRKVPINQLPLTAYNLQNSYRLLYVSPVFTYKHHLGVIKAIYNLREKGYPITIQLVGGIGQKSVGKILQEKIDLIDPKKEYIFWNQHVDLNGVIKYYHNCEGFIFASSCENMPNILIEAMASSLPIVCSSRNPMPEFLESAGLYFNPENVQELQIQLEIMLNNCSLRTELSLKAFNIANKFNWEICSNETFNFLVSISLKNNKNVK